MHMHLSMHADHADLRYAGDYYSTIVLVFSFCCHLSSPPVARCSFPGMVACTHMQIMRTYTGDQTAPIGVAMAKCDPLGPLMINVVKLYSTPDGEAFTALGRVYSGAVRTGQKVKVSNC